MISKIFCWIGFHAWSKWKDYKIPETVVWQARKCETCGKTQTKNIFHLNSWLKSVKGF